MAHQVLWTKLIVETFVDEACLSKTEERVLRMRASGYTNTEIADTLCLSLSTVNRYIKVLKRKYDAVQKSTPLLPPRRFSAEETYMDNH